MVLKGQDTISGQEGRATANINGSIEDLFFIKKLEASFEKNKEEIKTIGKRGTQHKSTGWSGKGTMTIYYLSTLFRKLALDYAKNGKDTFFDITVENNDPTSSVGLQTVVLMNCNIDSTILAKLDVDSAALDEEVSFTFDDFDFLNEFSKPV